MNLSKYKVSGFQALADPSRMAIIHLLSKEKRNINSLADEFAISRPAVSKHIKILYEAGFIKITNSGRERQCELSREGFDEIKSWLAYFENFWNQKLDSLGIFLKNDSNGKN